MGDETATNASEETIAEHVEELSPQGRANYERGRDFAKTHGQTFDPFKAWNPADLTEAKIEQIYTGAQGSIERDLGRERFGLQIYRELPAASQASIYPEGEDGFHATIASYLRRRQELEASHAQALYHLSERIERAKPKKPAPTIAELEARLAVLESVKA
jgi:hypothetical protein